MPEALTRKKRHFIQILLLFFLCQIPFDIFSQVIPDKSACFSLGGSFGYREIKENILLPLASRGVISGVNCRKEWHRLSDYYFDAYLGYSRLKTKPETEFESWEARIEVSWTHLFPLVNKTRFGFYSGYIAGYSWNLTDYPVWDEAHAYWCTVLSAGLTMQINLSTAAGRKWTNRISLRPVGLASRPDPDRLYAQEKWTLFNILGITNSAYYPFLSGHNFDFDWMSEFSPGNSEKINLTLYCIYGFSVHTGPDDPSIEMLRFQGGLRFSL